MKNSFSQSFDLIFNAGNIKNLFVQLGLFFFKATLPLFLAIMIGGVAANLFQSGFIIASEPLKPDFKRLNPIEGFKNIFSKKALFEFFKTTLKLLVAGLATYYFIKGNLYNILSFVNDGIQNILYHFKDLVVSLTLRIAFVLGILAFIDFLYKKYDYKKNLRMTKQELKDEYKETEGNPDIKSARKQKQKQLAMSRMMSKVPEATVVITNPTHLAIALFYDLNKDSAPIVVAKGADIVAQKIKELAKENKIPCIENKPLARVLYKKVEINEVIPVELYQAVAEILAVVYEIQEKNRFQKG